jgi:DNA-binding MarR family transcriptional regulator
MKGTRPVTQTEYEALAAFRARLRQFLAFSEAAAETLGLTPRQHQALLAIRGAPKGESMTIGELAVHVRLRQNSAAELADRLQSLGLLRRQTSTEDRRQIHVLLTPRGARTLEKLATVHRQELGQLVPQLQTLLKSLGKRRAPAAEKR